VTYFVILRGPLGAGKTTVARAFARATGAEVVSVDELLESEPWDGGSERLFLKTNRRVAALVRTAARRSRPAVVDGNFYWSRVISDLERRLPLPHLVFELRAPLRLCIERDRHRPNAYGSTATREVYRKVARVRRGIPLDGRLPLRRTVGTMLRMVTGLAREPPRRSIPRRGSRTRARRRRARRPGAASAGELGPLLR